jgi:ATP-dependent helicase HrpA
MSRLASFDVKNCLTKDVGALLSLKRKIQNAQKKQSNCEKLIQQFQKRYERSQQTVEQRAQRVPKVDFPKQLPITERCDDIAKALQNNQVIVIAGETGSGKTTQLPKICLSAGFGRRGLIGHTQPRRVAATSVAARIAEEMNCKLGEQVGVSVRFHEKTSEQGYIKLMTDGILLAEMQQDPYLSQYEVIIIDEAHERSINIDFLMGLLKRLLQKRQDLKVVITSATIDLERFSKFFNNAPIIKVEGRTFPVDIRYLPPEPEQIPHGENPELWQINRAVELACKEGYGDILIFLPGEGEIRQTAKQLRRLNLSQTHILPLYARLSISEQQKVFQPVQGRKIVLATNVAETSLTVPGIRYVIDPGTARISRFSMRSKIQRLQVEKISKASANQRAGRCGRVASGVCFRLYSEQDFEQRAEFTLPEIKRTNLASVILQMKLMGIDDPERFPFIENAEAKHWRDGFTLLFELGALDKNNQLTELGKKVAKLPVDPKLAVMIFSGIPHAVKEMLIIASLYSVRDPRERPHDKTQKADECHARWNDKKSDFITYLNLWHGLHKKQEELTNRQFKEFCYDNFINFTAWLEWRNTYRQLKQLVQQTGIEINKKPADYEQIHRALIPALLTNLLNATTEPHYLGARNSKVFVHPSSVNFKNKSQWMVAAELMDTGKLYARTTAPIESSWIEDAAEHLAKVNYLDPHWRKKKGEAAAYMQKSIFGLVYVSGRLVSFADQDPNLSRRWLIEKGLIDGDLITRAPFHAANQKLLKSFREEEERQRRTDIIKTDEELVSFFEQRLPEWVTTAKKLELWLKKDWKKRNQLLTLSESDVLNPETELDESAFPKFISIRDSELALEYRFEPGHEDDGVSICIPLPMLKQFQPNDFDWLVPGMLQEKILCSIKALPKSIRKNFIPAPEFAEACYQRLKDKWGKGEFFQELAESLYQITGVAVDIEHWRTIELPLHLQPNYKVYADSKKPIKKGRNLAELQQTLSSDVKKALSNAPQLQALSDKSSEQKPIKKAVTSFTEWLPNRSFPLEVESDTLKHKTRILQALQDKRTHVEIIGCESRYQADLTHQRGVCRLLLLAVDKKLKYFLRSWHQRKELTRLATLTCGYDSLVDQYALALAKQHLPEYPVEHYEQYIPVLDQFTQQFNEAMNEGLSLMLSLLSMTQRISRRVYEKVEPKYLQSYLDIREQLNFLWKQDAIYEFGLQRVEQYGRYFQALEKRLERMDINYPREAQALRQFKQIEQRVLKIPPSPHNRAYSEALNELYWMLQEFRISLFAQGIKTAYPISEKRIEKQIDSLKYL